LRKQENYGNHFSSVGNQVNILGMCNFEDILFVEGEKGKLVCVHSFFVRPQKLCGCFIGIPQNFAAFLLLTT
jgi:hypothetical protein